MKQQHKSSLNELVERLPQSVKTTLVKRLTHGYELPLQERVFVNRNLRMEKIQYVGFDLDWTLATYDRLPLEQWTFEQVIERLVQLHGYPAVIRSAEFRPEFSHRGLLIDKTQGTVLKMDRHRYVGRAYLGRTELGTAERNRLYRQERIDLTRERFYHVDTLFELPEVNLFTEIVELKSRQPASLPLSYEQIFGDIRVAIDSLHADGTLKNKIIAGPEAFIPRDPTIPLTLQKLALGGYKILLITNSEWYYTNAICSYLFDKDALGLESWRDLFDLVVVSAEKPLFFKKNRPFVELDEQGAEISSVLVPEWKRIYRTGSRDGLMSLLGSLGEKVLYIGDHIYGDIRWTRVSSTWRTALVIRELEEELLHQKALATEIAHLKELKFELTGLGRELDNLREAAALLSSLGSEDDQAAALHQLVLQSMHESASQHEALRSRTTEIQDRISWCFNPTWGSLFRQGQSKSLFASQVEDFACLYTSHLRNFLHYGNTHYFRVVTDPLAHEGEL
jgi:HAD superfamily 5'-nucleotidase-like hydrolase